MVKRVHDPSLHLPRADTDGLVRSLTLMGVAKDAASGKKTHDDYRLKSGQHLVSDGLCELKAMVNETLIWKIGAEATFAMVIEYSFTEKQWKVIRVDFFYPGRLREAKFYSELKALGFRPRKIAAIQAMQV